MICYHRRSINSISYHCNNNNSNSNSKTTYHITTGNGSSNFIRYNSCSRRCIISKKVALLLLLLLVVITMIMSKSTISAFTFVTQRYGGSNTQNYHHNLNRLHQVVLSYRTNHILVVSKQSRQPQSSSTSALSLISKSLQSQSSQSSSQSSFQKAYFSKKQFRDNMKWLDDELIRLKAKEESLLEDEIDPGVVEGTDLRIVKYPHRALRAENELVTMEEIQDGSILKIAREMFLVMYAANGIGLAAPQIGINKCLMIYNESGDRSKWLQEHIYINPTIIEHSTSTDIEIEGCLSFPNMNGYVERAKWIKVEALNSKGKKIIKKFTGWEARIFQHEYDHLHGIVYIDRIIHEHPMIPDQTDNNMKITLRINELIQEHNTKLYGEPEL